MWVIAVCHEVWRFSTWNEILCSVIHFSWTPLIPCIRKFKPIRPCRLATAMKYLCAPHHPGNIFFIGVYNPHIYSIVLGNLEISNSIAPVLLFVIWFFQHASMQLADNVVSILCCCLGFQFPQSFEIVHAPEKQGSRSPHVSCTAISTRGLRDGNQKRRSSCKGAAQSP